jgi:EAL and modified HD-GYP domain-containing signal transduction protein
LDGVDCGLKLRGEARSQTIECWRANETVSCAASAEACQPARATAEAASTPPSRFLARQPILDARRDVVGYELLFRSGWENSFRGEADEASRRVMDHCLYVGIDSLTEGGLAFVNCTREALLGRLFTLLSPRNTVLEVLETVEPDAEVVAACMDARALGYRIALDDFVPFPQMQALVEIADYVKVDFLLSGPAERREIKRMTRKSRAALLAEKVESQDQFDIARREGFEYFQGYFFCRPRMVATREIPPNRLNYLRLLVELTRTTMNLEEVLRIVRMEASLCYRLLRLANSALWGLRETVTSVRGAFMVVGEDRLRTLVAVAASSFLGQGQSAALVEMSLLRARFCELVAPLVGENPKEQFMLGLLSLIDAMLGTSMEMIAKELPFRDEARAALLGVKNRAAAPLCLIRSFELGAWASCECEPEGVAISEETLTTLYLESVTWARESMGASR